MKKPLVPYAGAERKKPRQKKEDQSFLEPRLLDLERLLIEELIRVGKRIRELEAEREQKAKELALIRRGYYRQTIAHQFRPK